MASTIARLPSLGNIAAELGPFNAAYFVPSSSYTRVRHRERPIVIGRKGTGKTAIRLALLNEAATTSLVLATDLVFRDYPWNVHNSVFSSEVPAKSRFVDTWLFLMLIELAKLVVANNQKRYASKDQIATHDSVRRFILENWGAVAFDHRDIFRAHELKVSAGFSPQLFGFSAGGVEVSRVPRARLGDSLVAMNKWLKAALATILADDTEYFLIFDSLDLDFDPGRADLQDSLIGLLLASQVFTTWNSSLDRKAAVVVLIRDDIFDTLHFQEKNKLFNELVERIHWHEDGNGPNSLKTVVDTRIRVLLGGVECTDPWSLVFSPKDSYHHLAARTYLRPRDIIQFANICLRMARERVLGSESDVDRVSRSDIRAARAPYSGYLRRELDDEIHAHYPDWEKWLELLRRVEVTNFTQKAFADVCLQAPELASGMSAPAILEALYQFGLIGFAGRQGALGQAEYWKYRNPEVAFDHAAQYRVHPGLRETLYPAGPRDFARLEEQLEPDSDS